MPEPARYRNGTERTVRILDRSATFDLNQRFRSRIKSRPRATEINIEGSFIEYMFMPKIRIQSFWRMW